MAKVIRVLIYEGDAENIRVTMKNSSLNGIQNSYLRMTSIITKVENCKCFGCNTLCNNTNFICDYCATKAEKIVTEAKSDTE